MKDEETRQKIIQLRSEGHSIRVVADQLECSLMLTNRVE
jgi:hypothetical protein